jgi:protein-S-isoprenylcysteine O-methyltransferase Ste14
VSLTQILARWRVTLGFVCGAVVLWLAAPTWPLLGLGAAVAALGEAVRIWAAGHLEKSREVTSSGPYRFSRHPLYLGSVLIGTGVAIASASLWVAVIAAAYLGSTITAAIRAEEAHLREKFGDAYDAYAARRAPPVTRPWSRARAFSNREHHTLVGVLLAFAVLALKIVLGRGGI